MPTTGQNFCNEVINTVYKSTLSSHRKVVIKPDVSISKNDSNKVILKRDEKGKKSSRVDVKKVLSQSKPKAKLSKYAIDFGVNTLISGPKLCDSNCVTNTSGKKRLCKCGRKVIFKMVDNFTQYADTLSCSTQCPNKCSIETDTGLFPHETLKRYSQGRPIALRHSDIKQPDASFVIYEKTTPKTIYKPKYPIHLAVNRWAISRQPIRGPDF